MIGTTVSHYQILDELGRGGMGVVYRARDTRLGREVALKFLPEGLSQSASALARFRREARAASALNHPHICTLYDIGEHEGRHFIAMELLRGQTLRERLTAGPLEPAEVARLGAQLADALEAAHALGIVHRDIKPGNVFITERGDAKLLDFGLAKSTGAAEADTSAPTMDGEVTRAEGVLGTPGYMSPEQALGRRLDRRTDIFSLGVVLYVMATGRRPFAADSPPAFLDALLHSDPELVTSVNPETPSALSEVIRRCLEKDPEARYQDARELRRDLLEDPDIGEPKARFAPTTRQPVVRRVAVVVVALLVVVIVTAALWLWTGRGTVSARASSPVVAILPFEAPGAESTSGGLGEALRAALLTELSEIRALRLVSSSFLGADRQQAMEKAQDLGAQLFVEGEVREQPGDGSGSAARELRIDARITDARTGLVLWSESFEEDARRLLSLQSRIARGVAVFLSIPLSRDESRRLARQPTSSLEAMRLYARAQRLQEEPTRAESLGQAIADLETAVSLDEEFALAHAGLSQALWMEYQSSRNPASLDRAIEEAELAIGLDPQLPQARLARALVSSGEASLAAAPGDVGTILARHPRPAAAHRELGLIYEKVGLLEEAERAFRRAVDLDRDDWFSWNHLGVFLIRHRDPTEARRAFERAAELAPSGVQVPREKLASVAALEARFDEALAILEDLPRPVADAELLNTMATAFYYSDRPDKWQKAEQFYRRAVERNPDRAEYRGNLADVYRALGREQEALEHYRRAMRLAEREADEASATIDALLLYALYAAKAGECEQALESGREARSEMTPSSSRLHRLASVFSLCRDREATLEALSGAIAAGFPTAFVLQEEEFEWLGGEPEFEALVEKSASQ